MEHTKPLTKEDERHGTIAGYSAHKRQGIRLCPKCKEAKHEYGINRAFGYSLTQYKELLAKQGGRCAICGTKPGRRNLAIEHSHYTGTIRGLCCLNCNRNLLGALERHETELVANYDRAIKFLQDAKADYLRHTLVESDNQD